MDLPCRPDFPALRGQCRTTTSGIDGPFRQATESTVRALTRPFADEQVTVRMSALGRDGVLHGAAALVLDGELGLS